MVRWSSRRGKVSLQPDLAYGCCRPRSPLQPWPRWTGINWSTSTVLAALRCLDLAAIEISLRDARVRAHQPRSAAHRDPLDRSRCRHVDGYAYVDTPAPVSDVAPGQLKHLLELNALVLCGRARPVAPPTPVTGRRPELLSSTTSATPASRTSSSGTPGTTTSFSAWFSRPGVRADAQHAAALHRGQPSHRRARDELRAKSAGLPLRAVADQRPRLLRGVHGAPNTCANVVALFRLPGIWCRLVALLHDHDNARYRLA